jgi:hypothetical protein
MHRLCWSDIKSALFAELDTIMRELHALPRILAEMLAERGKGS